MGSSAHFTYALQITNRSADCTANQGIGVAIVSSRIGFWLLGLVLGVLAAASVPETLFPGVRPTVFGASFLIIGGFGEIFQSLRTRREVETAWKRRDGRPADGRVELASLDSFPGEPNPFDARFRRFAGGGRDAIRDDDRFEEHQAENSCPPLLGRVVIVSIFLGRHGRAWADSELAEAHEALFRAAVWLEREAQRRRVRVNLELSDLDFVADDDAPDLVAVGFAAQGDEVGPFEADATTKALLRATRAAAQLGFQDASELFQTVEHHLKADVTVWLLHPREAGRSFAVPRDERAPGGLSLSVCYPREASFPEPLNGPARVDPVTVVHELLHLFGASDKYGYALKAYAPKSVTTRDVMRLSEGRLARLRIDSATAAEIGWTADGKD